MSTWGKKQESNSFTSRKDPSLTYLLLSLQLASTTEKRRIHMRDQILYQPYRRTYPSTRVSLRQRNSCESRTKSFTRNYFTNSYKKTFRNSEKPKKNRICQRLSKRSKLKSFRSCSRSSLFKRLRQIRCARRLISWELTWKTLGSWPSWTKSTWVSMSNQVSFL